MSDQIELIYIHCPSEFTCLVVSLHHTVTANTAKTTSINLCQVHS